jgi:glycosyltransferase involved in cell wall biosynthesis
LEKRREMPDHLKINWFSPLPPAKSGIAIYTETLIPVLRKQAALTLWTDQQECNDRLDQGGVVRRFDPQRPPWRELNEADVSFYNIGNNRLFHKGIWEVSRRLSGIVILHDLCLQHFLTQLYLNDWKDFEEYGRVMAFYYGEKGRRAAERFYAEPSTIDQLAVEFPLTPLAVHNALAAVIHNRAGQQALAFQPQLPTFYLPLPYSPGTATHPITPAFQSSPKPPYRLIISGYIGLNRQLEPFLEAWAGMLEKAAFRLRICGHISNSNYIESRIRELGLQHLAEVCGYVSDERLNAELMQADLAVNLRYPTVGEASLTQLLIWEHALPALVSEVGWYATLPRSTVAFVRPDHQSEDIRRQLRAFLENPQRFAEMGREGYQTLMREHAADHYAEALVAMAAAARGWSIRRGRLTMAERAGGDMRQWIAPAASDALTGRLARAIWEISGDVATAMKTRA